MSYKTIVVQLDTSERAQARLEYALKLAGQFDAHVTGVSLAFTPDPRSFYVMAGSAEYFAAHREFRRQRHDALERIFQAELLRAGISGQWIDHNEYASEAIPRYARYADLVIAGQDDPDDPESFIADHFPETTVLSAGRPVLFIPTLARSRHSARMSWLHGAAAAKQPAPFTTRSHCCCAPKKQPSLRLMV